MLRVNDKINITCEGFDGCEIGTVVRVDEVGLEDNNLIAPGSGEFTLFVVILRMEDGEFRSLIGKDTQEAQKYSDLDWRFPSKAPSDVKIEKQ